MPDGATLTKSPKPSPHHVTSTQPHAADLLQHDLEATGVSALTDGAGTSDPAGETRDQEDAGALLGGIDPPADLPDPDLGENSLKVLERRYLIRGEDGDLAETPRQMFWRVARTVAGAEVKFDAEPEEALEVARDFYTLMSQRMFLPNSPCLTNAGRGSGMLSACFVLPVPDSVEGIYESVKATALIQKAGGGTGFNFSRVRPAGRLVKSSGGQGAGPLTFMDVFSKASDSIQQGAFRKGANMGILRVDHPDIADFIVCKDDRSKLTNFNVSVAVTDRFMEQLGEDPSAAHQVLDPLTGDWAPLERDGSTCTVGDLWSSIVEHAHASGEPGVVFIDRINATNPIKNVGQIEATNPCGEQPLHAWDSCNLGSINLGRFVIPSLDEATGASTSSFHWEAYREVIHTCTRFLDDVIEVNEYPLREIAEMSRSTRRIGLGVMGFADALYSLGLPYDSQEACAFGEEIMRVLNEESHLASEVLAEERGVFGAWEGSEFEAQGKRLRNSYTTTIAPTGTISIIAGCSGGIEPMFSLAFERQIMKDAEGKPTIMREVNEVFERVAEASGYFSNELVEKILAEGTLAHVEGVPEADQRLFVTAHDISPEWHMRMQAAFQRHCDASISKTINFPKSASVDDVRQIYDMAVDMGVKGVTVYRDGCRDMQPMALKGADRPTGGMATDAAGAGTAHPTPAAEVIQGGAQLDPVRLPEIMPSLRIRQMTPFGNMHVKVSVDPQSGREREVFAQLGKGGDVANSDLEAICRILSLWLRSNGSLEKAVSQLSGIGSSLSVPTKDGRIMSLADGLATALLRYKTAKDEYGLEALLLGRVSAEELEGDPTQKRSSGAKVNDAERYKVKCPQCEGAISFEEGCVMCHSCGFSQC